MNDRVDTRIESAKHSPIQATLPLRLPAYGVTPLTRLTVGSILVAIIFAEIITMFTGILPGIILYSMLLVVLVNLSYFAKSSASRRLYLALTLPCLLRILSLAMPVQLVTLLYRYIMVGVPLVLSIGMVVRFNGLPGLRSNLTRLEWMSQLMIGFSGIPLGVLAYLVLPKPPDIMSIHTWYLVFIQMIAITIFGSIPEEVIFRGLIQKGLNYPFGLLGFIFSSVLYASMFFGTHSISFIIFYGLIGLIMSIWVQVSDSLWGVLVAHSVLNIVILLIYYLH